MLRDKVHLWYVFTDGLSDPSLLASYEALLSPEERARMHRFLRAKDRHQHLVARALVRTALSRYADVKPEAWSFTTNRYGRPEIAAPDAGPLRFNLSHTKGLIACVVAWDREVGVDVEDMDRPTNYVELAQRFFALSEAATVASLPVEQQREVFFDFWTLKESYIKARGMGLALPLSDFAFRLEEPVTIGFSGTIEDDPTNWRFERMRPSERHKLAAAMRCVPGAALTLLAREVTPVAE